MTTLSAQPADADGRDSNPLRDARLSFVGCGVMAEAMVAGLLRRALVTPAQVFASHPRPARREELRERYRISVFESNREAATAGGDDAGGHPSVVVLAVKPQRLGRVLEELKGSLAEDQLVLSIVAGARSETIAGGLRHPSVVRAMPNTPAQVGEGMTAWTAGEEVGDDGREVVRAVLGALGREIYVETEHMIDMATALSATGPTYIFM